MTTKNNDPGDGEKAIRLVFKHHFQFNTKRVLPTAFRSNNTSVFIAERLEDQSGTGLHRDNFEDYGRASVPSGRIRSVEFKDENQTVKPFDVEMAPAATTPPFEDLADAHAHITGPHDPDTGKLVDGAAVALAKCVNEKGNLDKEPRKA